MRRKRWVRRELVYTLVAFAVTALVLVLAAVSWRRGGALRWLSTGLAAVVAIWAWRRAQLVRRRRRQGGVAGPG